MANLFEGYRVRLRAVEPSDWEFYFHWNFDTDSARNSYEISFPQSQDAVKAWTAEESTKHPQNDNFRFQIETLGGELVGTLNTHTCEPHVGRFSYGIVIPSEHRRKGYATEAIRLVLRYYFDERRYQKVDAWVYDFNTPSIQLHESMGFVQEGRLRRAVFTGGKYHDELIFGMTAEEFRQVHTGKLP